MLLTTRYPHISCRYQRIITTNKNMTALQELIERLEFIKSTAITDDARASLQVAISSAKSRLGMEREQIMSAHLAGQESEVDHIGLNETEYLQAKIVTENPYNYHELDVRDARAFIRGYETALRQHTISGSLLESGFQNYKGSKEMDVFSPDVMAALGILNEPKETKVMEKTIWKWQLDKGVNNISMPIGAELLTAQMQYDEISIWAIVDRNAETEIRTFEVIPTGTPILYDTGTARKYISTIQTLGGKLVFHIFEYTGV